MIGVVHTYAEFSTFQLSCVFRKVGNFYVGRLSFGWEDAQLPTLNL